MTTAFKLGLPTDIPWMRICVTEDMIDRKICDPRMPPKWASSIAVFKYVPPDEYQEHDEYKISYLKVAVSITGYVPRNREIEGRLDWDEMTSEEIAEVENLLNEYQPCTGALVQVSVSAEESGNPTAREQPFFMDFEPKKRELYEMATDTLERSSRSLQTLSVGKSGRTTQSQEVLDIDMGGGGFGMQGSYAGTGGGFNYTAPSGQWGTKEVGSHESGVIRTVDNSTERRETHAFTTQISQLYHMLDSYHVGTNRALFLLEPRPHVVEQPSGFVQGPRPIDGVQEFFLVVATPKVTRDYCVSVRLDTAHYTEEDILEHAKLQDSVSVSVSVSPPSRTDAQAEFTDYDYIDVTPGGDRRYACYEKHVDDTENYIVADNHVGYKIDLANSGGYDIVSESSSRGGRSVTITSDAERLTARVWATSRKCYDDGGAFCLDCPSTIHSSSANSSLSLVVYLIEKEPTLKVGVRKYLLVTTRGLCCCEGGGSGGYQRPGVVDVIDVDDLIKRKGKQFGLVLAENLTPSSEGSMRLASTLRQRSGSVQKGREPSQDPDKAAGMSIQEANATSKLFRAELARAAASRKATLPIPALFHDFFIEKLQRRLRMRPASRKKIEQPPTELPQDLRDRLAKALNLEPAKLRRRDILSLPTEQLMRAGKLEAEAAAEVRLRAAGVRFRRDGGKELEGPEEQDRPRSKRK